MFNEPTPYTYQCLSLTIMRDLLTKNVLKILIQISVEIYQVRCNDLISIKMYSLFIVSCIESI